MKPGKPRIRITGIAKILIAFICALGTAVPLSVATQQSALAAGCTPTHNTTTDIWWIPYGCYNVVIPPSHKCQIFNDAGLNSADGNVTDLIQCVDVYATNANGNESVWGEGEFYCQGEYTRCQGMNVNVDFKYTDNPSFGNVTVPQRNYKCSGTGCPNGSRALVSTQHSPGDGILYGFLAEAWLPAGNVISIPTVPADHNLLSLDSGQYDVGFALS